jgi:hypothetical protein
VKLGRDKVNEIDGTNTKREEKRGTGTRNKGQGINYIPDTWGLGLGIIIWVCVTYCNSRVFFDLDNSKLFDNSPSLDHH